MVMEKFNQSESAQKIMQVGIDVKCMHTNFFGHGLFSFGDKISFQVWPNFSFSIVHGSEKMLLFRMGSKILCI